MGDMFLISGSQQVNACIANCDQMLRDSEIVIVGDLYIGNYYHPFSQQQYC